MTCDRYPFLVLLDRRSATSGLQAGLRLNHDTTLVLQACCDRRVAGVLQACCRRAGVLQTCCTLHRHARRLQQSHVRRPAAPNASPNPPPAPPTPASRLARTARWPVAGRWASTSAQARTHDRLHLPLLAPDIRHPWSDSHTSTTAPEALPHTPCCLHAPPRHHSIHASDPCGRVARAGGCVLPSCPAVWLSGVSDESARGTRPPNDQSASASASGMRRGARATGDGPHDTSGQDARCGQDGRGTTSGRAASGQRPAVYHDMAWPHVAVPPVADGRRDAKVWHLAGFNCLSTSNGLGGLPRRAIQQRGACMTFPLE